MTEFIRKVDLATIISRPLGVTSLVGGVDDGLFPLLVTELASAKRNIAAVDSQSDGASSHSSPAVVVFPDQDSFDQAARLLGSLSDLVDVIEFPAYDCQPYDRASPSRRIVEKRIVALSRLSRLTEPSSALAPPVSERSTIVLTTSGAIMQRLPPISRFQDYQFNLEIDAQLDVKSLTERLNECGYSRVDLTQAPSEYSIRGGILDLFSVGAAFPVRIDLFGSEIDSLSLFDPSTQRSLKKVTDYAVNPAEEIFLGSQEIANFRRSYLHEHGAPKGEDDVYISVTQGVRTMGLEHWLGYYYSETSCLLDYVGLADIFFAQYASDRMYQAWDNLEKNYDVRVNRLSERKAGDPIYNPAQPMSLYFKPSELLDRCRDRIDTSVFPANSQPNFLIDLQSKVSRNFSLERKSQDVGLYDVVATHIKTTIAEGKRVIIAAWSDSGAKQLTSLFARHGLREVTQMAASEYTLRAKNLKIAVLTLPIERGFSTPGYELISEQDILGTRFLAKKSSRSGSAAKMISNLSAIAVGDHVVHNEHGVARYDGMVTITTEGASYDCLKLIYAGDDRLFLPAQNIELLSRFGSKQSQPQLDRLGSSAWQMKKAKAKKRIKEVASELIALEAERARAVVPKVDIPLGAYDEFVAGFPFSETDDQADAIKSVLTDLQRGRPVDRLVCGDVGFGKTEVALRASFVVAFNGGQVAVIVPTTLLARQHYKNFLARFAGFPLSVVQLSRFVSARQRKENLAAIANGTADVVVGTHALLGKAVKFKQLELIVVDEEQRFGVVHKEKLKRMRSAAHVVSLSATPIPRTLQMAMSGIRELSLITTPPLDRMSVRSTVTVFDEPTIRNALLREKEREGQSLLVAPRITDLHRLQEFMREKIPEISFVVVHGQMSTTELEDRVDDFYSGKHDLLISTNIIESGLDIPNANTLIVYRSEMFGLAQLYQLRGRVGRSNRRAYVQFTIPVGKILNPVAKRRLDVLSSLDDLGSGFSLASHDLDIRGAGNLLGEEQAGHINEVGYELYQHMLQEEVRAQRDGESAEAEQSEWSPQLSLGVSARIPESYVETDDLRLALYRRLGDVETDEQITDFRDELSDRFGALPDDAALVLAVAQLKLCCRRANVDRISAGTTGFSLGFHNNWIPTPERLLAEIKSSRGKMRLLPDQRIFVQADWLNDADKVQVITRYVNWLVGLVSQ